VRWLNAHAAWKRCTVALALGAAFVAVARPGLAQALAATPEPLTFDQSRSVYNRMLKPAEPADGVDWEARVDALLHEQPGDVIVTAVGDMIFNQQITTLPEPHHRQLLRLMQEADIATATSSSRSTTGPSCSGVLQLPHADQLRLELAATGINLVSMANNHSLDFGPRACRTA